MKNLQQYSNGHYDGFETDSLILDALEFVANDSLLSEDSLAYQLWSSGRMDANTSARFVARLLESDLADGQILCWGQGKLVYTAINNQIEFK